MDPGIQQEMLSFLPRLRRFTYGLTGTKDAGDDLLQSTCERAIREIDSWAPGTRLDSWMYKIARNLHLNNLRAQKVRGEPQDPAVLDYHFPLDGTRMAEAHLTFENVKTCVNLLPEEQRSVLLLVCVEGLSYKEVSAVLDLPAGTIASRLARARLSLRQLMEMEEEPQRDSGDSLDTVGSK